MGGGWCSVPSTILILRARVVADEDASLKAFMRGGETVVNVIREGKGTFDAGLETGLGVGHVDREM